MGKSDIAGLRKKFRKSILSKSSDLGMDRVSLAPASLRDAILHLKTEVKLSFDFLRHITCIDHLGEDPRFELVYVLYSMSRKKQLVIKVPLSEADPSVDSIHDIFASAKAAEMEVWEMFGITFNAHPDMGKGVERESGHPLRRDSTHP